MSKNYSKQTVLEAIAWLKKQPNDWMKYIKDSNIAVQIYLKAQKSKYDKKKDSSFKKELELYQQSKPPTFLKKINVVQQKDKQVNQQQNPEVYLIKKTKSDFSGTGPNPVLKNSANKDTNKHFVESVIPENEKKLLLDKITFGTVKKTQNKWNIQSETEALRLLVQLGHNALEKLD